MGNSIHFIVKNDDLVGQKVQSVEARGWLKGLRLRKKGRNKKEGW